MDLQPKLPPSIPLEGSPKDILDYVQAVSRAYSSGCQQQFGVKYGFLTVQRLQMMVKEDFADGLKISKAVSFDQSNLNDLFCKLYHKFKEQEDVDLIKGMQNIKLRLDSTLDGKFKWTTPIDIWWIEVTRTLEQVGATDDSLDAEKERSIVKLLLAGIENQIVRGKMGLKAPFKIEKLYEFLSEEATRHDSAQEVFRTYENKEVQPTNSGARSNETGARNNGGNGKKDSGRNPNSDKGKSNTSEEPAIRKFQESI